MKEHHNRKPAVFLDRDGTINHDIGILRSENQIRLYDDAVSSLLQLQEHYELFVITNQGGISQGLVTSKEVDRINDAIDQLLRNAGVCITQWYVCPHQRSDNCSCIKPNSYFLELAAEDFGIDISRSYIIGDHPHDVETGADKGVFGLYLMTGHGMKHLREVALAHPVFHHLSHAAQWILDHPGQREDLQRSVTEGARAIAEGKLAAFPTETVYGLGADALDENAAAAIFTAKKRPLHDPLIVHIADIEQAKNLFLETPSAAVALMEAFWPGPLTLVLPKASIVPDIITAGGPTVAVRMPSHPFALQLIRESGRPIAAPSANLFGRTSPTTAAHVKEQLEGSYEVLIDGGACRVGVESTVLSLADGTPRILRPGGITAEQIESVIGPVATNRILETDSAASPGMLPSHYAPRTRFMLTANPGEYADDPDSAIILYEPNEEEFSYKGKVFVLSHEGDLRGAAAMLYSTMRLVDTMGFSKIVAQRFPDFGIGVATNDRMQRAAADFT